MALVARQNLHIALQTMLDDETDVLYERFFGHPLIQKLRKRSEEGFPSYISQPYFVKVITELSSQKEPITMDAIRAGVQQLVDRSRSPPGNHRLSLRLHRTGRRTVS